jgi:hypothetical protein
MKVGAGFWSCDGDVDGTVTGGVGVLVGVATGVGDGVGATAVGVGSGCLPSECLGGSVCVLELATACGVVVGTVTWIGNEIGTTVAVWALLGVGLATGAVGLAVADGVAVAEGDVRGIDVGDGVVLRCVVTWGDGTMTGPPVPVVTAKPGVLPAGWVAVLFGVTASEPNTIT